MIVAFCGHREVFDPETVDTWLNETVEELIREGADCFYLGGYGQFDTLAAAAVQKQKERYPQIRSVLVLPYLDREYDVSPYDETVYPSLENVPKRYAISHRNKYMIDRSDVVIAFVTHSFGGASSSPSEHKKETCCADLFTVPKSGRSIHITISVTRTLSAILS